MTAPGLRFLAGHRSMRPVFSAPAEPCACDLTVALWGVGSRLADGGPERSGLFAEVADAAGVDLVIHAHHVTEVGVTPGGISVRNVAQPVIDDCYRFIQLGAGSATERSTDRVSR